MVPNCMTLRKLKKLQNLRKIFYYDFEHKYSQILSNILFKEWFLFFSWVWIFKREKLFEKG